MGVVSYQVRLSVNSSDLRFDGNVDIEVEDVESPFSVNCLELTCWDARLDGEPATTIDDRANESVWFHAVPTGRHRLGLSFSGRASEQGLSGLYNSSFGSGRTLLTTQLYPTGCRRVFPCVDEPTAKAVFQFTVEIDDKLEIVFNTPSESESRANGRRTIVFQPTPRMSTYLLYLGIGPFEFLTGRVEGVEIVVATPPGRSASGALAVDVAARCLKGYESYYGIPYPLTKLHLVAVPAFWAGAMENWGAITFRETALLVDKTTDAFLRRYIVVTIAHEIAHQWFGNLVTMRWWNDFWLNESFATFVSYALVDRLFPGQEWWADFLPRETGRGILRDSLASTHPIEVEIRNASEIAEIADDISYGKGSSVLRMIENFLGEETFRQGVTDYLNRFQYSNAQGEDLWSSLEAASQHPVAKIMARWIRTPGHPVVDVERVGSDLRLRQTRFILSRSTDETLWPIPVTIDAADGRHQFLMEEREATENVPASGRVIVNPGRTGFYHVRYHGGLRDELWGQLASLPSIDQWGIFLDAYLFLLDGSLPPPEYRKTLRTLARTSGYLPARTGIVQLRDLYPVFHDRAEWASAATEFLHAQLDRVGLEPRKGEPETAGVVRALGSLYLPLWDPRFAESLGARFSNFDSVPADLRGAVALARVRSGGTKGYSEVRERIPRARTDDEAEQLAVALAFAPGDSQIVRTLELLASNELSSSRVWDVLLQVGYNPQSYRLLWPWLRDHLRQLESKWTGTALLGPLLTVMIAHIGLDRADEVLRYLESNSFPEANRSIDEGIERLEVLRRLRSRPESV